MENPEKNLQQYKNQFNKIKLLDEISTQIAYFGVQCGNAQMVDYVDMNCGGIPDGEFFQVVDINAPEQFLQMYTQTAENRFAFAVTELLKIDSRYINALTEFCTRTGKDMQLPQVSSIEEAYNTINYFVLDGMPFDQTKEILSKDETSITWQKTKETHLNAWTKAGSSLEIYYQLQKCFIEGLLSASNATLQIENNECFTLKLKS